jgi:hypothetical protein
MLAQITLTPAESKKLIAKAIANIDTVKKAAKEGMIVLHPSSSTYFVVEEITGKKPDTNYWVCGVVAPRGTCVEMAMLNFPPLPNNTPPSPRPGGGSGDFSSWWVIKKGEISPTAKISELMEQMTSGDAFIKGANALDSQGTAGILIGEPMSGGTLGFVLSAWRKKQFNLIYSVGLEKMIPISVTEAAKAAKPAKYDYCMGLPTGLFPCTDGETVTEIDAIKMLSGADAVPIAAGGLGGAEGSITLVIKGNEEQVKKAIDFIEQSKGAKLPQLRLRKCQGCPAGHCRFPVGDKHWNLI